MYYKDHELPVWLCHLKLLGTSLFTISRDLWSGIWRALFHLWRFVALAKTAPALCSPQSGCIPVEKIHCLLARVSAGEMTDVGRNWYHFVGVESSLKYRFFSIFQLGADPATGYSVVKVVQGNRSNNLSLNSSLQVELEPQKISMLLWVKLLPRETIQLLSLLHCQQLKH